jgi:hypothetical protein
VACIKSRDGGDVLPEEFITEKQADDEADRLMALTVTPECPQGRKYYSFKTDKEVMGADEIAATETMFLLTCEVCNGEWGELVHHTLHKNIDGAKEKQAKSVDPKDLKAALAAAGGREDTVNKWEEKDDHVWEFRTGSWGYVVWKIRPLKVLA